MARFSAPWPALVEFVLGLLSVIASALVWHRYPFHAWVPLMLHITLIAAVTGVLLPKRGAVCVALQLAVGAVVASGQVPVWLDPIATPPAGAARPLGSSAKLFLVSMAVGVGCGALSFLGARWLYRKVTATP